jgi:hypothetical protein
MEQTIPPTNPGHARAIAWTFVLMLSSFVLGVFVGLHPSWLPINVPLPAGGSSLTSDETGAGPSPSGTPTTMPTTQEATTQP